MINTAWVDSGIQTKYNDFIVVVFLKSRDDRY